MERNELTFEEFDDAVTVAKILMKNGYVVMLSMEEELYVLNFIWSEHCDRNEVIFKPWYAEDTEDTEDTKDE